MLLLISTLYFASVEFCLGQKEIENWTKVTKISYKGEGGKVQTTARGDIIVTVTNTGLLCDAKTVSNYEFYIDVDQSLKIIFHFKKKGTKKHTQKIHTRA